MGPVYFVCGFALLMLSAKATASGDWFVGAMCFVLAPVCFMKGIRWMRSAR